MPSTSLKMDIKPPLDPLEPYKQFNLVFEKKLRNIEKRKIRLDGYKDKLSNGGVLNEDQTQAIKLYDNVIQSMDIIKEFQKMYSMTIAESEKYQKKNLKRNKLEKSNLSSERFQEYLLLDFVLSQFGDEEVRDDFSGEKNGAILISEEELLALDNIANLIAGDDTIIYKDRISAHSEIIVNYCECKDSPITSDGSFTFSQLHTLVERILSNDYFVNSSSRNKNETEEDVVNDVEHVNIDEVNEEVEKVCNEDKISSEILDEFEVIQHEDFNNAVKEAESEKDVIQQQSYTAIINLENMDTVIDQNTANMGKPSEHTGKVKPLPKVKNDKSKKRDKSEKLNAHLKHLDIEDDEFLKLKQQPQNPRSFSEIVTSVQGNFNFSQDSELTDGKTKAEFRQSAAQRHHQPSAYDPKLSPPQQQALYNEQSKIEPIRSKQDDVYRNNINIQNDLQTSTNMFSEHERLTPPQHMQQQHHQTEIHQQQYHSGHPMHPQQSRINGNQQQQQHQQHQQQQQSFQASHPSQPPHVSQPPHASLYTQPPHVSQPSQPTHASQSGHPSQVLIPSQQPHLSHHPQSQHPHSPLTSQSPLPQPPPPPHLSQHHHQEQLLHQNQSAQSHYQNMPPPHVVHSQSDRENKSPPNQSEQGISEPIRDAANIQPPQQPPHSRQHPYHHRGHQTANRGQGDGRYRPNNYPHNENSRENYQRIIPHVFSRDSHHRGSNEDRSENYRNEPHRNDPRNNVNEGGRPMRDGIGHRGMRGNSNNNYSRGGRGGGRGNYESQRYINRGQNPNQYNRKGETN